jgi:hypothetical protein
MFAARARSLPNCARHAALACFTTDSIPAQTLSEQNKCHGREAATRPLPPPRHPPSPLSGRLEGWL